MSEQNLQETVDKSAKTDTAQEAKINLQKAMELLDSIDLVKSEPAPVAPAPAAAPVAPAAPAPESDEYSEEELAKSQALYPTVEEVEGGIVEVNDFLAKSLDRIAAVELSTMKLCKAVETLCSDLKKSDVSKEITDRLEKLEKSQMIVATAQKALVKSNQGFEKLFMIDSFMPQTEPKIAGQEDKIMKSEQPAAAPKKEMSVMDKNKLFKAWQTRAIDLDTYRKHNMEGTLPAGL